MSPRRHGESERARFWRELIGEWERSGQTQAAFCQARGVKHGTLAWWRRQLRAALRGERPRPEPARSLKGEGGFVEVPLTALPASPGYEIVLAGGRIVRVPEHFDADSVARLIRAVEAAC